VGVVYEANHIPTVSATICLLHQLKQLPECSFFEIVDFNFHVLQMILDYLLWIATWPALVMFWLSRSKEDLLSFWSIWNLAPLQTTPVRYSKSQSSQPSGTHPGASTSNQTRSTEAPDSESLGEQYGGPYPINSDAQARSDAPSDCLARLLEIIPDVEPGHATRLITTALANNGQAEALGHVLHSLFEQSDYPKAKKSKSVKRADRQDHVNLINAGGSSKAHFAFGYGDKSRPFRGGPDYAELALVRISCIIVVS
jgi:hypothetical protein